MCAFSVVGGGEKWPGEKHHRVNPKPHLENWKKMFGPWDARKGKFAKKKRKGGLNPVVEGETGYLNKKR